MHKRLAGAIAAASLAIPFTVAGAATAQAATRYQLTVRIIDPSGHASCAQAQVISLPQDTSVMMGTGSRRELPAGTYNVAAWILSTCANVPNPTYTLADQVINLNRNRTVTLDARQGKPVRLGLNNAQAVAETLEIAPIVDGQWAFNPTTVAPPVGRTRVIPTRSRLMQLYVYSIWEKKGNTEANPSPFRYDIVNVFHGGIPNGILIRTRTAQLARINVTVRAIDPNEQATLTLAPFNQVVVPLNASTTLGNTPARLVSYRTPGYEWEPLLEWDLNTQPDSTMMLRDNDLNQASYGHHTYNELWGAAVFAPAPGAVNGQTDAHQLSVGLIANDFAVADALHPSDEGNGKTQVRLFAGRKLLGKGEFFVNVAIPDASRTYTLTVGATRAASAVLSTQINGVWKFVAKGSSADLNQPVQVYGLQILPLALNLHNQADAGSLTRIALRAYAAGSINATPLPTVRAWASSTDGKSWQRISITRAGNHYVLLVRNAKAAGFTSLRVYVADHQGNSENLTVIHAYGVS